MPDLKGKPRNSSGRKRRFEISAVAIRLFSEQGLEATTIDEIAAAAKISPRTFFRHFAAKEEAVFPDHEERIAGLRERLADRHGAISPLGSVTEVTRASVLQYMEEPALYRPRFELVRRTPPLRDRERLIDYHYESVIAEYLLAEIEGGDPLDVHTLARSAAAAQVTAVNLALDHWLGSSDDEALALLDRSMKMLDQAFTPQIRACESKNDGMVTITIPATAAVQKSLAEALKAAGREFPLGGT